LASAQIRQDRIHDTVLIAGELIGNALMHARPMSDGNVRITWGVGGGRARIEVQDGGSASIPAPRCADPAQPDGRGLAIVAAIADGWGYEMRDGCCVVWAELRVG
jgi:two-component sensor histidine kinase